MRIRVATISHVDGSKSDHRPDLCLCRLEHDSSGRIEAQTETRGVQKASAVQECGVSFG